jgi:uncharacterized protein (DUF305 family)
MKKITIVLAVLAVTLTLLAAACGGDGGAAPAEPAATVEAPGGASAAEVPFDRAFIDAMVPHHEAAIAAAEAAKAAGLSEPELVEIADAIMATQQEEIDQMRAWREEWFGSSQTDPDGADALGMSMEEMGMQHDPADMAAAMDIDGAFAAMMIDHHNGAIAMAEMALERAQHEEIRDLAQAIMQAQQHEVEVMTPHMEETHH